MRPSAEFILITGASSGIGAAIAKQLAAPGRHLGLVARRQAQLESIAKSCQERGATVDIFLCDLTDEQNRQHVIDNVSSQWSRLDVLVNCAGFGWYGHIWDMPWPIAKTMIALHNTAITHLSMASIRLMRRNGAGTIININSIISDLHVQGSGLYAATKSYEHALSVAMDRELRQQHIRVCCVKPGPVQTAFFDQSVKKQAGFRIPGERFSITPERVARRVDRLLTHPRKLTYVPWYYSFMPLVESGFGWLLDIAGPVLLRANPQVTKD